MNLPILESSSIYVVIIGIAAAFFSAVAVFIVHKIRKANEKIEEVLNNAEVFDALEQGSGGSETRLLTDDGSLDWEGAAMDVLYRARTVFSDADPRETDGNHTELTEEEIFQVGSDLIFLLNYVFTTYPLNGRSTMSVREGCGVAAQQEKAEQKENSVEIKLIHEMRDRLSFLSWCWEIGQSSILEVASRYTEIQAARAQQKRDEIYLQMLASIPEGTSQQAIKKITMRYFQHSTAQKNYVEIVTYYFEKIMEYHKEFSQYSLKG
jgi:hypothetical protein